MCDRWWGCACDPVYGGALYREERGKGEEGTDVFSGPCAEHMLVLTVEIPRISPNKPVDWPDLALLLT